MPGPCTRTAGPVKRVGLAARQWASPPETAGRSCGSAPTTGRTQGRQPRRGCSKRQCVWPRRPHARPRPRHRKRTGTAARGAGTTSRSQPPNVSRTTRTRSVFKATSTRPEGDQQLQPVVGSRNLCQTPKNVLRNTPPQPHGPDPGPARLPAPAQCQRPPPGRPGRRTQRTRPHPQRERHPLGRTPPQSRSLIPTRQTDAVRALAGGPGTSGSLGIPTHGVVARAAARCWISVAATRREARPRPR